MTKKCEIMLSEINHVTTFLEYSGYTLASNRSDIETLMDISGKNKFRKAFSFHSCLLKHSYMGADSAIINHSY